MALGQSFGNLAGLARLGLLTTALGLTSACSSPRVVEDSDPWAVDFNDKLHQSDYDGACDVYADYTNAVYADPDASYYMKSYTAQYAASYVGRTHPSREELDGKFAFVKGIVAPDVLDFWNNLENIRTEVYEAHSDPVDVQIRIAVWSFGLGALLSLGVGIGFSVFSRKQTPSTSHDEEPHTLTTGKAVVIGGPFVLGALFGFFCLGDGLLYFYDGIGENIWGFKPLPQVSCDSDS